MCLLMTPQLHQLERSGPTKVLCKDVELTSGQLGDGKREWGSGVEKPSSPPREEEETYGFPISNHLVANPL